MAPHTKPAIIYEPLAFQMAMDLARRNSGTTSAARVGFVPTMGALHAGHIALIREARRRVGPEGAVAVSIFVNPAQFGPNEDYTLYPREIDADVARCAEAGVDVVFSPRPEAMYPPDEQTRVQVRALAEPLCGRFRPNHFEGVATVVTKLFALAGPCVAVFGRKDYQQFRLVSRLAADLFLPVEIVGLSTVREPDGLALSSRNRFLTPANRDRAVVIPRALGAAVRSWQQGYRDLEALCTQVEHALRPAVDAIDYVEGHDADSLGPYDGTAPRAVLAVAVHVGGTRLIDNVVLGEDPPPATAIPCPC